MIGGSRDSFEAFGGVSEAALVMGLLSLAVGTRQYRAIHPLQSDQTPEIFLISALNLAAINFEPSVEGWISSQKYQLSGP